MFQKNFNVNVFFSQVTVQKNLRFMRCCYGCKIAKWVMQTVMPLLFFPGFVTYNVSYVEHFLCICSCRLFVMFEKFLTAIVVPFTSCYCRFSVDFYSLVSILDKFVFSLLFSALNLIL